MHQSESDNSISTSLSESSCTPIVGELECLRLEAVVFSGRCPGGGDPGGRGGGGGPHGGRGVVVLACGSLSNVSDPRAGRAYPV